MAINIDELREKGSSGGRFRGMSRSKTFEMMKLVNEYQWEIYSLKFKINDLLNKINEIKNNKDK